MHIGLFGGTFNPVHIGHLRAALEVVEKFPLDECYLVPSATPPHKAAGDMVDVNIRYDMICRAVAGQAGLKVSDIELKRAGPSYTVDTIRLFGEKLPKSDRLYLIVGLDAFLELDTWKSYRTLLKSVAFIVMSRPERGLERSSERWRALNDFLCHVISKEYTGSEKRSVFSHPQLMPVHVINVTMLDISSSKIRELIRSGCSVRYLLPAEVLDIVHSRGLYV
ncbi:MAG: nicotinate-nucleotide adenylyltransferase [Desulfobacterales bacterium]|jgi:nicotinate-nucleotide adenylyltransferase